MFDNMTQRIIIGIKKFIRQVMQELVLLLHFFNENTGKCNENLSIYKKL